MEDPGKNKWFGKIPRPKVWKLKLKLCPRRKISRSSKKFN